LKNEEDKSIKQGRLCHLHPKARLYMPTEIGLLSNEVSFMVSDDSGGTHDQSTPPQHPMEVDPELYTAEGGDSEDIQKHGE
jgi:hypothetical protein